MVFDVAGTIFLNSPLRIVNDSITIAGQTAPGQGVCIARHPVNVAADNVILRYLRFRVGNEGGGEPDGLSGYDHRNIIVDHCTISWSVDEACSIYGNTDATVQWCLISESLRTAGHRKGRHGYGAIVGGRRMSFHHNLLAHHESRAPRLGARPGTQTEELVDMRCNVFYNWAGNGCYGGESSANVIHASFPLLLCLRCFSVLLSKASRPSRSYTVKNLEKTTSAAARRPTPGSWLDG